MFIEKRNALRKFQAAIQKHQGLGIRCKDALFIQDVV